MNVTDDRRQTDATTYVR